MMNRKRVKRFFSSFIVLILIPILFTGCFNYNDINKVTFTTSVIFDIDDFDQVIIYLDCIKPYRSTNESSEKGRRIIYKGTGKTALEALIDVNRVSSYKMNYSQTRAYIFTEKAARNGIKKFLDLINNNSEFQVKPSAFVYYGDVDDLLETASTDEEYLGLFLNDLIGKDRYNPKAVKSNINYYLSNTLMGSSTALLTSIDLKKDVLDKKVELNGSSIFKDNILVEKLDLEDSLIYNLLMGGVKSGSLEVTNPQSKENFVSLEILNSTVMNNFKLEDGIFKITKDISIEVAVADIQGKLIVDSEALNYLEYNEEQYIDGYCQYVFNKYKEKNLDIFDVERMAEMYYPKEDRNDILKKTEIEVNTNIIIKGTGVSKDSL